MTKPIFVFDLDGTLAISKQPIPEPIAEMLTNLTKHHQVAILTGGTINQVQIQVLNLLPKHAQISIYACSGTTYQLPNCQPITQSIPAKHRKALAAAIKKITKQLGHWCPNPAGNIIDDRISQITFSALGQNANPVIKKLWDVDGSKREAIIKALQPYLGEYVAHIGGYTSIDITHAGQTKQTGIELIAKHYGINTNQIIFIGDDMQEGGNDHPATLTNATCIPTRNWLNTIQIVKDLTNDPIP
jgi:hypothetical protein